MKYYRFSFYFFVSVVFIISAFNMSTAQAAGNIGDLCKVGSTFGVLADDPDEGDDTKICQEEDGTSELVGTFTVVTASDSCGDGKGVYTGTDTYCAVDNSTSAFDIFTAAIAPDDLSCDGTFQNGACEAFPVIPTTPPVQPSTFTALSDSGQTPGGTQQSMCV